MADQDLRSTALAAVHESLGATFTDFAGWRMPVRYDSDLAEHRAVRESAGIFDLSHMGEIHLRGPQAGDALD
ncbi:MAG: glycine cleavage system protein T, partial [Brachybacterium sp.]|nr:glycine cleavage system protein T [Brachybacterium sp.]